MAATLEVTLQVASCVCLSSLLLLEWMALGTVVHETLILKNLYVPQDSPPEESQQEVLGTLVSSFRASSLDESEVFTEEDLIGQTTTLLFVQPPLLTTNTDVLFAPLLHSIWNKRSGPVRVVCSGSRAECRLFRDKYQLGRVNHSSVDVLIDEDASLRSIFSVSSELRAVVIGLDGRITKVGGLDSDEFAEIPIRAFS